MKKKALFVSTVAFILLLSAIAYAFEEISPSQAYDMMILDPNVYVIDVRTPSEWIWTGLPEQDHRTKNTNLTTKIINVPYLIEYKGGKVFNENFLHKINELFDGDRTVTLITMCKNESRSREAAAMIEAAGYEVFALTNGGELNEKDENGKPEYRHVNEHVKEGVTFSYNSPANYTR